MVGVLVRATVGVAAAAICLQAGAAGDGAGTAKLTVGGHVRLQLALSIDDLKQLPVQQLEDVRIVRGNASGSPAVQATRRYTGSLVRDVLDRAQPLEKNRFDLRRSIVIATATDGYRAVFSWAELYLSPIGDGVLIVYERDGRSLADDEGPLALVSLKDTRPGPRHVKWLRPIELRLVSD